MSSPLRSTRRRGLTLPVEAHVVLLHLTVEQREEMVAQRLLDHLDGEEDEWLNDD